VQTLTTTEPAAVADQPTRVGRIVALDGLRGLAVALVVVYHFAPDVLPAGFLGVDVFFVLSGFLITTLALSEHERSGSLAVGAFFGRRARRLLPAAIACVAAVTVTAVLLQPAADRQPLRGEAMASLLYGANWWSVAQGSSYQATFGVESPLNHFWSLAVEEQFYLLFPLVIVGLAALLARRGADRRRLAAWLLGGSVVLALGSARLMAALHDPLTDPSRAYLGSDTRAQAVLVGVAAACVLHLWRDRLGARGVRRALVAVAVAAVAVVVWMSRTVDFRTDWLYQGGFLLVAVASGAVALSLATSRGGPSRLFETRALCVLGLYSYGIYLWHWPVRVFLDEDRTGLDGVALFAVRIALTAALTVLSARLIEDRFRHGRRSPDTAASNGSPETGTERRTPPRTLGWAAAVAVAGAAVWIVAGPGGGPAGADSSTDAPDVPVAAAPDPTVTTAPPSPGRIGPVFGPARVLWEGDSVAWTLGGGELRFPQPDGYDSPFDPNQVVIWNKASYMCPLLDEVTLTMGRPRRGSLCADREQSWGAAIDAFRPDVVSWSGGLRDVNDVQVDGRWVAFGTPEWDAAYLDGLGRLRDLVTAKGSTLLLIGQQDPFPHPDETEEEGLLPQNIWRWGHLRELQRRFADQHPVDTRAVDLQQVLCPSGTCPSTAPDGSDYLVDWLHWSDEGARAVGPVVSAAILRALDVPPPATAQATATSAAAPAPTTAAN
jgi:peptidoglycan/LPS O-acetylase OafA/YrhL